MTKPIRIQRKRTKGWKMPENTVYVGRPSFFGNPYKVGTMFKEFKHGKVIVRKIKSVEESLRLYEQFANSEIDFEYLKGKNLACWCPLDKPCHADILLRLANE